MARAKCTFNLGSHLFTGRICSLCHDLRKLTKKHVEIVETLQIVPLP
jgi:hypothetical protein